MKKLLIVLALLLAMGGAFLAAQDSYTKEESDAAFATKGATTMIWMVVGAALVFVMQAGFALVEVGLTRAKNTANILMKNLMDFCLGSLAFFFVGWGLMYWASKGGWLA